MIKASISLQDLRRKIYVKAKTDKVWRFWGLYVHVCKMETLQEAYNMAKRNNGAPGIDGVTFEAIEEGGRIDRCGIEGRRFPRTKERSGFWEFPVFGTAWFREHLR